MRETSKSIMRRLHDVRFAMRHFLGDGIDIGGGDDPLVIYQELSPGMRLPSDYLDARIHV